VITEPTDFPELTDFLELADFAELMKFAELAKLTIKKRVELPEKSFCLPGNHHL